MNEIPFFIDVDNEKIFSIVHEPEQEVPFIGAYIFCHPFAEEKLWSHRVYVNFARELSKKGYLVIRFDMHGYGDSSGEFVNTSIETHINNVCSVINYLKQNYSFERLGLFGLRLGATIAVLASERSEAVTELILWEPIYNGDRYMQEMLRSNLAGQMTTKGKVEITRENLINDMKSGRPVNVEGYPVTYKYFTGISAINLLDNEVKYGVNCLINQIVRNIKQPINRDLERLQAHFNSCYLTKSHELQFWKEIKEFYNSAENLYSTTFSWLEDKYEN